MCISELCVDFRGGLWWAAAGKHSFHLTITSPSPRPHDLSVNVALTERQKILARMLNSTSPTSPNIPKLRERTRVETRTNKSRVVSVCVQWMFCRSSATYRNCPQFHLNKFSMLNWTTRHAWHTHPYCVYRNYSRIKALWTCPEPQSSHISAHQ